eukprot:g3958.t1
MGVGDAHQRHVIASRLSSTIETMFEREEEEEEEEPKRHVEEQFRRQCVEQFRRQCAPLESAGIGCVFFNMSTVLAVNHAWSKRWGFTEDEVRGRTLKILQGPESYTPEFLSFDRNVRERSGPCQAVLTNYTKSRCPVRVLVQVFPLAKDHYVEFVIFDQVNDNPDSNVSTGHKTSRHELTAQFPLPPPPKMPNKAKKKKIKEEDLQNNRMELMQMESVRITIDAGANKPCAHDCASSALLGAAQMTSSSRSSRLVTIRRKMQEGLRKQQMADILLDACPEEHKLQYITAVDNPARKIELVCMKPVTEHSSKDGAMISTLEPPKSTTDKAINERDHGAPPSRGHEKSRSTRSLAVFLCVQLMLILVVATSWMLVVSRYSDSPDAFGLLECERVAAFPVVVWLHFLVFFLVATLQGFVVDRDLVERILDVLQWSTDSLLAMEDDASDFDWDTCVMLDGETCFCREIEDVTEERRPGDKACGMSCHRGKDQLVALAISGLLVACLMFQLNEVVSVSEVLTLTGHSIASDGVPAQVFDGFTLPKLTRLDFGSSSPNGLTALAGLKSMHLESNKLVGMVPSDISVLAKLTELFMGKNMLSGQIPDALTALAGLQVLRLEENMFTGVIPSEISSLSNLQEMSVKNNRLSGPVEGILTAFTGLRELRLDGNGFTGTLPPGIRALSKLRKLFLGGNKLTGSIDGSLFLSLTDLQILHLENNMLTGQLPLQISTHGAKSYVLESGLQFQHSAKQVRDAKTRASIGGMPSHVRELARVARKVVKEETIFHTKQGAPLYELSGYKRDACLNESSDGNCGDFSAATSNRNSCGSGGGANGLIGDWGVSRVVDMGYVFDRKRSFNADLAKWDVGEVTDMEYIFRYAEKFNGNLSNWNVARVTNMNHMFQNAYVFNGDLSNWNVARVTTMRFMFLNCPVFNGDVSKWNVVVVKDMFSTFDHARQFNVDVSNWNASKNKLALPTNHVPAFAASISLFEKPSIHDAAIPKDKFVVTIASLLYLSFPTLIKGTFQLFDCRRVGNGWWLHVDLEERCYEGRHGTMIGLLGVTQLIIYVFGLPFMMLWFL